MCFVQESFNKQGLKIIGIQVGMKADFCNLIYLGSRGRIMSSRQRWWGDPVSKTVWWSSSSGKVPALSSNLSTAKKIFLKGCGHGRVV
jgi:hypothetical protein